MTNVSYNWDEDVLDVEDYQELRAFQNAQLDAIRRARRFGASFVVERDGKLVELSSDQTLELERQGGQRLAELNRKIAELQNRPSGNAALVLKETPPPNLPKA